MKVKQLSDDAIKKLSEPAVDKQGNLIREGITPEQQAILKDPARARETIDKFTTRPINFL